VPGRTVTRRASASERDDPLHVFAALDDERPPTVWPHCECRRRAATPAPLPRARSSSGGDVVAVFGDDDPERSIWYTEASVPIAPAAERIEQHVAADLAAEPFFKTRSDAPVVG